MSKKSKVSKTSSKISSKSENLYVSPSFLKKFDKLSTRKQRSQFSNPTSRTTRESPDSIKLSKQPVKPISSLPKDAAAHFGHFYGLRDSEETIRTGKTNDFSREETTTFVVAPRTEFTRQMVHKLERTAGTQEYARQVSALLEETVEPPNFRLSSLPVEDSIPDGRQNPSGYPLWYKEPYKMPFMSDEVYKLLREKCENITSQKGKNVFDDSPSEEDTYEDYSDDEQSGQEENEDKHVSDSSLPKKSELTNTSSSRSTSNTETKDTDSQ